MEGGFWRRKLAISEGIWSNRGIGGFVWGILGVSFNFPRVARPGPILGCSLFHCVTTNIFVLLADSTDKTPKHFR